MTNDVRKFMEELIAYLSTIGYVKPKDLPNIDLYMDQVTTFMDEQLAACKRHDEDKILTKTMINNYAKNDLLPPPEKKKYSKEHVLTLIFIYYLKNILSISDIQGILNPITNRYFGNKDDRNMEDVYDEVFALEHEELEKLIKDLGKKYKTASGTFLEFPEEDRELLQSFSYICLLSYDVYIKKMLIERTIDQVSASLKEKEELAKQEEEKQKQAQKEKREQAKREAQEAKRNNK